MLFVYNKILHCFLSISRNINSLKSIQERFDHIETNKVLNVATLLDPRFKKGMFYPIV